MSVVHVVMRDVQTPKKSPRSAKDEMETDKTAPAAAAPGSGRGGEVRMSVPSPVSRCALQRAAKSKAGSYADEVIPHSWVLCVD
ncbi:MAG TPA: hypothetical protein VHA06_06350 [Candidatus Angelobacter sp.]|nr:hypothetical protein [Candidatus Angelobacter sp.]